MTMRPLASVTSTAVLLSLAACGTPVVANPAAPTPASTPTSPRAPRPTVPVATTPSTGLLLSTGRRVRRDHLGGACETRFIGSGHFRFEERVGALAYAHQDVFAGLSYSSHYRYLEVDVTESRLAQGRRLLRAAVPRAQRGRVMIVVVPRSLATLEAQVAHLPWKDASLGLTGAGPWGQAGGLQMTVEPRFMMLVGGQWMPRDPARARRLVRLGGVCFMPAGWATAS